jgi:hypothetical protein
VVLFAGTMKNSYLCSVDDKDENGAQGSGTFVSGLQEFTPCPGRKNESPEVGKRVN